MSITIAAPTERREMNKRTAKQTEHYEVKLMTQIS